jgi:HTH-type transcriptional regulator / antitoxin HigA
MMDVRPIRTEADHQAALAEIATLMDAKMGTSDGDRLDILVTLVEAYETAHIPIEAPDPISAIVFMMEQKQFSRRDLEPAIGSRAGGGGSQSAARADAADDPPAEPSSRYPG